MEMRAPSGSEQEAAELKAWLRQLLETQNVSGDIKDINVQFMQDSSGEPAIFIAFIVENDVKPSQEKIARLRQVAHLVTTSVLQRDPTRWPHVLLRE